MWLCVLGFSKLQHVCADSLTSLPLCLGVLHRAENSFGREWAARVRSPRVWKEGDGSRRDLVLPSPLDWFPWQGCVTVGTMGLATQET